MLGGSGGLHSLTHLRPLYGIAWESAWNSERPSRMIRRSYNQTSTVNAKTQSGMTTHSRHRSPAATVHGAPNPIHAPGSPRRDASFERAGSGLSVVFPEEGMTEAVPIGDVGDPAEIGAVGDAMDEVPATGDVPGPVVTAEPLPDADTTLDVDCPGAGL